MGFTGGGQPHNHGETTASSPGTNSKLSSSQSILNPYITVYMWKEFLNYYSFFVFEKFYH